MKPIQIISQDLFDKIRSRFTNLEMGDETGAVTIDPAQARFFDFDYVQEGVNLGRVSISLNDLGSLKVYYSQGITENQDEVATRSWYNFLKEMRFFAMRRLMRFDTRDIAKSNLDRNDFQYLAAKAPKSEESIAENIIKLKFNTIELPKDKISSYVKEYIESYGIETSHQKFISNIKLLGTSKLIESKQSEEIQNFIQALNNLDTKKEIKIGDKFSVLAFEIVFAWSEINVFGFTEPKKVADIKLHRDGTINYIKFTDGDRYPRTTPATYNGKPIVQTAYFDNKNTAERALTFLMLKVPDGWELNTDNLDSPLGGMKGNNDMLEGLEDQSVAHQIKKKNNMENIKESRWSQKSSRKTSRAVAGTTEVIVRHANPVEETYPGARSQRKNIKAIFIQNRDGERFKYPFIHPAGAFAMAQHVDHGGVPHDPAGRAIIRMSEQIAQLQEFQRQVRPASLHDDAMGITERAMAKLNELKSCVANLSKRKYYESWIAEFNETEEPMLGELDAVTMETYKQKFTQTSFNENLASLFPLIHSIMQEANTVELEDYVGEGEGQHTVYCSQCGGEFKSDKPTGFSHCVSHKGMKNYDVDESNSANEFAQFESWAEAVEQGRLTDDEIAELKSALADLESSGQKLELGPQGQTAWEFFSSFGLDDSDLENKLKAMADVDPETDPMEILQVWARDNYPELLVALGMSGTAEPQNEPAAEPQQPVAETVDSKSIMREVARVVGSFYNRDNPNIGPFRSEETIALDVEKQISEKFGESHGMRARAIAEKFMEKLTQEWAQRHGGEVGEAKQDSKPGWMLRQMRDKGDPAYQKIADKQAAMAALKQPSKNKEQGVAEGLPSSLSNSDYTSGKTVKHTSSNCTSCHGRKTMYKLDGKLYADNKAGATKVKCPTCKGTGDKQGATEGLTKQARARKEAESVKAVIARLEQELKDPNPHIDKDDIRRRLETEKRRLELYRDVLDEQGVAEDSAQIDSVKFGDMVLQFREMDTHGKLKLFRFDVVQNGEVIGEAIYDDYYGKLTIETDEESDTLPHDHPLVRKVKEKIYQNSNDSVSEEMSSIIKLAGLKSK